MAISPEQIARNVTSKALSMAAVAVTTIPIVGTIVGLLFTLFGGSIFGGDNVAKDTQDAIKELNDRLKKLADNGVAEWSNYTSFEDHWSVNGPSRFLVLVSYLSDIDPELAKIATGLIPSQSVIDDALFKKCFPFIPMWEMLYMKWLEAGSPTYQYTYVIKNPENDEYQTFYYGEEFADFCRQSFLAMENITTYINSRGIS